MDFAAARMPHVACPPPMAGFQASAVGNFLRVAALAPNDQVCSNMVRHLSRKDIAEEIIDIIAGGLSTTRILLWLDIDIPIFVFVEVVL
jgi:hypothetical protein